MLSGARGGKPQSKINRMKGPNYSFKATKHPDPLGDDIGI
jgi:hypothetical protein